MFLIRILRFILFGFLLTLIARTALAFVSGLSGGRSDRRRLCSKCRGTGWIAIEGATHRACDCGVLPDETRGRIVEPPKR